MIGPIKANDARSTWRYLERPSQFASGTDNNYRRFLLSLSQKESAMSTFDERDTQQTGYDYSEINSTSSAPGWMLGAIVAVAILGMIWYGVRGPARLGPAPDHPAIQHTPHPPAPPPEPTTPKP